MRLQDNGTGITRDSVTFFREHRHELGEVTDVAVRFPGFSDPHDPYTMTMRDEAGNEMLLSGCTAGYVGEAPRAAMQILAELGFDAEQARRVFTEPDLVLSRDIHARRAAMFVAVAPSTRLAVRQPTVPGRRCERDR